MIVRRVGSLLVVLLLAACGPEISDQSAQPDANNPFAAAPRLLDGFDEPGEPRDWRGGDTALFGMVVQNDAKMTAYFIRLVVTTGSATERATELEATIKDVQGKDVTVKMASRMMEVEATIYDWQGRKIESTDAMLPEGYLRRGYSAIGAKAARDRLGPADSLKAALSLSALLKVIQYDALLLGLLAQTADVGNKQLSILMTSTGIHKATDPLPEGLGVRDTYTIPFRLVTDLPAPGGKTIESTLLDCKMLVTRADPPLHLAAGVLRIEGESIDGSRRVRLELLGARNGLTGPGE